VGPLPTCACSHKRYGGLVVVVVVVVVVVSGGGGGGGGLRYRSSIVCRWQ